jgi:hypothetical protein
MQASHPQVKVLEVTAAGRVKVRLFDKKGNFYGEGALRATRWFDEDEDCYVNTIMGIHNDELPEGLSFNQLHTILSNAH